MKKAILTIMALATLSLTAATSKAQDPFEASLNYLRGQDMQYEQQLNNWMANAQQQDQQYVQQLRQMYNDYRSPAHVLIARAEAQSRAQDPGSWNSFDNRMAGNQRSFERRNSAMQDAFRSVNEASMNSYNNRSNSQQRSHDRYIDAINDRGYYNDPTSGRTVELDYSDFGVQTDGTNYYQQGGNGQMYQRDNYGYENEMNEIDW